MNLHTIRSSNGDLKISPDGYIKEDLSNDEHEMIFRFDVGRYHREFGFDPDDESDILDWGLWFEHWNDKKQILEVCYEAPIPPKEQGNY